MQVQQNNVKVMSDISYRPSSSPVALAVEYAVKEHPYPKVLAAESEGYLRN